MGKKLLFYTSIFVLLQNSLMAVAPVLTFTETTVTTTTGTIETSGSGDTADLGTESDTTTTADTGDWYIGDDLDNTLVYTPNLSDQNDIYGRAGNDKIIPTDTTLEDYYGQYYGEDGNDFIQLTWGTWSEAYGGDGDDTLLGHRGPEDCDAQYFYGGNGDDKIYVPENFTGTGTRIYGDDGFDTMIVYGLSNNFTVSKSWGRYYLTRNDTGGKLRFQDIEKIIFTTDDTPNISGGDEGEVFYFDNSTTLSETPTTTSTAELTTVTLFEHRFSFDATGVSGYTAYLDFISDKVSIIRDVSTGIEYTILARNVTDNNENILGQTGYVEIPNLTDGTRELILIGETQMTTTELSEIRLTIKVPGF